MANDLTFGMDVVIDKILGLGQFDALGKKLQSVVAKAVEDGLLQGAPEARESLRGFYGKSDVASRNSALKRLYAYSAKVEADEIKRANKEAADQKKKEDKQREREWIKMLDDRDKYEERKAKFEAAEAAYKLYSPYSTISATASYAEATIARQNLQYLTRITNRDLIDEEGLRSATTQQLIERSRANWEAKNIRYDLPFNRLAREVAEAERQADRRSWRTALQSDEALARQMFEAELGHSVSDNAWAQIKYDEVFGASKAQAAWERGARRDAALEAERNAQRKKESAFNVGVFGEVADDVDEAAAALERLGQTAKVAGMLLSAGSAFTSTYFTSVWGARAARNVTASETEYNERVKAGGSVIGGLLGGLAGFMIGGPIGAVIGGAGLGSIGGLYGDYRQKNLEEVLKTVATTTAARRDYLTFGGKSGFALGQAMEDAGFGGASDLNSMRWTGRTLPGAMALGMVGEQDMLMLSLMPEYFAALMGGADAASLAQAYSTSVGRLPAQLQPLVSTMAPGGSQGMYANAMDPQFSAFVNRHATDMFLLDRAFVAASEFTTAASRQRAMRNIGMAFSGVYEDINKARKGEHKSYLDLSYMSPMAGWATTIADAPSSYGTPKRSRADIGKDTYWMMNEIFRTNEPYSGLGYADALESMRALASTGLNLTIRVEGLGDASQNFSFDSMASGQTVSFNIGGM